MKFIVLIFFASPIFARPQHPYDYHQNHHGPGAPIGPDGTVVDTPEVLRAKSIFFEAFEKAASADHGNAEYSNEVDDDHSGYNSYSSPALYSSRVHHVDHHGYDGPPAPLNHEGRVVDTPEVAHLKSLHLAAHDDALSRSGPVHYEPY